MHVAIVLALHWAFGTPADGCIFLNPYCTPVVTKTKQCPKLLLGGWELPHFISRNLASSLFGVDQASVEPCTVAGWGHLTSCVQDLVSPAQEEDENLPSAAFFTTTRTSTGGAKTTVIFFAPNRSNEPHATYGIWTSGCQTIEFNLLDIGVWTRHVMGVESFLPVPVAIEGPTVSTLIESNRSSLMDQNSTRPALPMILVHGWDLEQLASRDLAYHFFGTVLASKQHPPVFAFYASGTP